jgi:membrane protein DedA with SNARE-associated domain
MNPLLAQALGAIIRHFLTILAGYFVAKGIWSPEQADQYVTSAAVAIVSGLVAIGWSLWNKHKGRLRLEAAMRLPAGASEQQVKDAADRGF